MSGAELSGSELKHLNRINGSFVVCIHYDMNMNPSLKATNLFISEFMPALLSALASVLKRGLLC